MDIASLEGADVNSLSVVQPTPSASQVENLLEMISIVRIEKDRIVPSHPVDDQV